MLKKWGDWGRNALINKKTANHRNSHRQVLIPSCVIYFIISSSHWFRIILLFPKYFLCFIECIHVSYSRTVSYQQVTLGREDLLHFCRLPEHWVQKLFRYDFNCQSSASWKHRILGSIQSGRKWYEASLGSAQNRFKSFVSLWEARLACGTLV